MSFTLSSRKVIAICLGLFSLNVISCETVESTTEPATNRTKDASETRYLLYTEVGSDYYLLELGNSTNLADSPFNETLRVYMIFHGWEGDGQTHWLMEMKDSILSVESSNVISVDWSEYAENIIYGTAVDDMYEVASLTSTFIDWLINATTITSGDFHLIGHSLGAHCAGLAAKGVTSGVIDRVTGLDPAGPFFHDEDASKRIDKSDANFVDIIHTNSCDFIQACLGLEESVGHVDFYPNGGQEQPGCHDPLCDHERSHDYFTESVWTNAFNTKAFISWPCVGWHSFEDGVCPECGADGCLEMGFYVDRSQEGDFYLTTEDSYPYAKGDIQ